MRVRRTIAIVSVVAAVTASASAVSANAWARPDETTRQLLMPNDFGDDGHTDPAVFSPAGNWMLITDGITFDPHFGTSGDQPAVWNDGSGLANPGVFRPSNGTWYLGNLLGVSQHVIPYGTAGDIPVQAHYRGIDKPTVLAVFRPSSGRWYVRDTGSYAFGRHGDVPVPGHYGNATATDYADSIAVFRPSSGVWFIRGVGSYRFGTHGDIPAPADYNEDGTTDIAVYRPSNSTWYIRGASHHRWGTHGDIPVTGDYDGDGRADVTVYRPSNGYLYINRGGRPMKIGAGTSDFPVGAAPYHD